MDLFSHQDQDYLMIIDYFSNFPQIIKLNSTSSSVIIRETKKIFSIYGIPDQVVSDRGLQFCSEEFRDFSRKWKFEHQTASPYH